MSIFSIIIRCLLKNRRVWKSLCWLCLKDGRLGGRAVHGFTVMANSKENFSIPVICPRECAWRSALGQPPLTCHQLSSWAVTQATPLHTSERISWLLCVLQLSGRPSLQEDRRETICGGRASSSSGYIGEPQIEHQGK